MECFPNPLDLLHTPNIQEPKKKAEKGENPSASWSCLAYHGTQSVLQGLLYKNYNEVPSQTIKCYEGCPSGGDNTVKP